MSYGIPPLLTEKHSGVPLLFSSASRAHPEVLTLFIGNTMTPQTKRKHSRQTIKRLTDHGNEVSLRVSIKDGRGLWSAFRTSSDGREVQTWELGNRPFP